MHYSQWQGTFTLEQGDITSPAIGSILSGGSTWHKAVSNFTEYPLLLKSGYSTTANGSAEEIICPPKATIRRISKGGPRDFSSYGIEPLYELPDATGIFSVNFRG